MKEVFVFGAGASRASAGTPLGSDLVWSYYEQSMELPPVTNGEPDNSEENHNFRNFIKFLEMAEDVFPELKGQVERFRQRGMYIWSPPTAVRSEKKYYVDDMLRSFITGDKKDAVRLIRRLIFEHIVEAPIVSRNALYEQFVGHCLKNRDSGEVSILSFNFDFLLHEDFKKYVYFDYLIPFDWIDINRARIYKKQNPFPLIKLNGSLDWGSCAKCQWRGLYFFGGRRDAPDSRRCHRCKEPVEPFIILPHEKYGDIAGLLWERARQELLAADTVTVIGYSFPEYDSRARKLFREGLSENAVVEVVDYCDFQEDEEERRDQIARMYHRLFPSLRKGVQVRLDGFEGYIRAANRDTTTYT